MIERVFREHWSRVLASLVGFLGDFELAEEACQEAFVVAVERWPRDGEPANPVAWLVTTGRNRAIDRLRRERRLAEKTRLLELPTAGGAVIDDSVIPDERLELIFCCCHPALAMEAQVALTLRSLGGLSTEQIAEAFLIAPEAMKRRLSRARAKITGSGNSVRHPRSERPARPHRRGSRGRIPDLQRGLRRPGRPCAGGDPIWGAPWPA